MKDPKLADERWLKTEWSEPSPVISTPRDTRVLAMSVNPGREPTSRVMLAKWVERGFEAFHEATVVRGEVISFLDTTFTHNTNANLPGVPGGSRGPDGAGGSAVSRSGDAALRRVLACLARRPADARRQCEAVRRGAVPGGPAAGRGGRMQPGIPGVNPGGAGMPMPGMGGMPMGPGGPVIEVQGQLLLPVDRRRLPRRRKSFPPCAVCTPRRNLVWEPDGTLSIRNELEDKGAIDQLKAAEAPPATTLGGAAVPGGAATPHRGGALDNLLGPESPQPRRRTPGRSR